VLIESGYRCAVPTCRGILAIDLHHIVEVSEDGGNDVGNLLALCPTCHALYHRKVISREAIYAWKGVVVALNQAFDRDSIDLLLFLSTPYAAQLRIDGTGVLRFARLIAAGLVGSLLVGQNGPFVLYQMGFTPKGLAFVNAWKKGDREAVAASLAVDNTALSTD
jgi:hypothetical protein